MASSRKAFLDVNPNLQDTFETPDPAPSTAASAAAAASGAAGTAATTTTTAAASAKETKGAEDAIDSQTPLSAKAAFRQFAGRVLDTSKQDFSESAARGGFVSTGEVERLPRRLASLETPVQRFHRLQAEMSEFLQELRLLQSDGRPLPLDQDVSMEQLAAETTALQQQLQLLTAGHPLVTAAAVSAADPKAMARADLSRQILAKIDAASTPAAAAAAVATAAPAEGGVVYELFYSPDRAGQESFSKLAALEARLTSLEQLAGVGADAAVASGGGGSLAAQMQGIEARLALLDESRLAMLSKQIEQANRDLDALLQRQRSAGGGAAAAPGSAATALPLDDARLREIIASVQQWEGVAQQIPALVDRLVSLRAVHEEAAAVAVTLRKLDTEQQEIRRLLSGNAGVLATLEQTFQANAATIRSNVEMLEKRLAALKV